MTKALTLQDESKARADSNKALAIQRATVKSTDFYSVGGKQQPSAKAMQKFANSQNLSSRVEKLEWHERDNFYSAACTAYVKAWRGAEMKPKQVSIQAVTLSMTAIIQRYVSKKLGSGWKPDDVEIDDSGHIMPKSDSLKRSMLSFLADQYAFLDRMAITKAESRAFDKLLRPDSADEYNVAHEPPPTDGGIDSETGEIIDPPSVPSDPEEPAGHLSPHPVDVASHQPHPEKAVAFPPTDEELEAHKKVVDAQLVKTAERAPTPQEKRLLDLIDAAGSSKKKLEEAAPEIEKARTSMTIEEHGVVMKHFWQCMTSAK